MNRNAESRFSHLPVDIDIPRSRFDRSCDHKTTFNAGELIPIFLDEVLPGDTFDMSVHSICRMSTPIFPVMDNAYLDTFFFFVPNRLVWDHWEAFNGQNDETYWTQPTEYNVPMLLAPKVQGLNPDKKPDGWDKGSLADYFGVPTGIVGNQNDTEGTNARFKVSALPFRAYVKIWNDWFRDQNTMDPAYFVTDDSDRVGRRRDEYDTVGIEAESALCGGMPLKVSKYHDYFTSALPAPQKGPGVTVSASGQLPVVASSSTHHAYDLLNPSNPVNYSSIQFDKDGQPFTSDFYEPVLNVQNGKGFLNFKSKSDPGTGLVKCSPSNLWAVAESFNPEFGSSNAQLSLLVNDIRLAFQIQKLYEKDARGGSRYIEILKSHFGVESPDGRLQRSEYLGGSHQPINISQVVQTSSTDSVSPQGNVSAYSMTVNSNSPFIKSFTEHGYIIGLACVRTLHTYQQGLNRLWSRQRRFDFYWPVLANIGEQAILKKEIFATNQSDTDGFGKIVNHNEEAFGYQEAWADYRYHPSFVTGAFRSNINGSLDAWHYADYYRGEDNSSFVIDKNFTLETDANINRTLAVQSSLEDQFIADFFFECYATRPMPLFSVPGMIDHH